MSKYRICAIGTSHLAAVKLGWETVSGEFPDYEIDFFGFPQTKNSSFSENIRVEAGAIVAVSDRFRRGFEMTSGGRTRIDGANYDAFAIFGLGMGGPIFACKLSTKHRTRDAVFPGAHLISRACLSAVIESALRSDRGLDPIRTVRAISDAPIILQANPVPAAHIVDNPRYADDPRSSGALLSVVKPIFDEKSAEVAAEHSFHFLPQPQETLAPSGFTKNEFMVGGLGFGGNEKGEQDFGHGNKVYGALVIRRVFEKLSQLALLRSAA